MAGLAALMPSGLYGATGFNGLAQGSLLDRFTTSSSREQQQPADAPVFADARRSSLAQRLMQVHAVDTSPYAGLDSYSAGAGWDS